MRESKHGGQIKRQPLHEIVAGRIRDLIIEGKLAPGDEINEVKLCELLGVSRTPVREATRTLAGEGLIVQYPSRSPIVRQFSQNEVRDMLEVIAELEALAVRCACAKATSVQIEEIAAAHKQMMHYFKTRERLAYYKLNQQIHSMIVEAAGNSSLSEVHGLLQARMKRIRYRGHSGPDRWASAAQEHVAIIEALLQRDAEKTENAVRSHIQNTWKRIQNDIPD